MARPNHESTGATEPELQIVLLSAHPVSAVQGYAVLGGRLQRFDEQPGGDHELIAAACPSLPETPLESWNSRWPDTASAVLYLPAHLALSRFVRPVCALKPALAGV